MEELPAENDAIATGTPTPVSPKEASSAGNENDSIVTPPATTAEEGTEMEINNLVKEEHDTSTNQQQQEQRPPSDAEQPSSFSPDLQEIDEDDEHDYGDAQSQPNGKEAWSLLRKGAVAAVGGTMVGVGLVMIPLPTPFGAVIASSGMAVLGTEFDSAARMNEKLVETATEHLETAREHVIRRMEPKTEQAEKQTVLKRTGNLLSRTVLPFLQRKQPTNSGDAQSSTDSSWEEAGEEVLLAHEDDEKDERVLEDELVNEPLDGTFVIVREDVVEENR